MRTIYLILVFAVCALTATAQPTGEIQQLLPAGNSDGDNFGASVSIDGNWAIVGSKFDDMAGSNAGAAYIYFFENGKWNSAGKLVASDASADDNFGISVSISGEYVVVGANQDDDMGSNSGSAYVFQRYGDVWLQVAKLNASNGQATDNFGISVSISGEYIAVGASNDDNVGANSGSVFVFQNIMGTWSQQAILTASDGAASDYFGTSVDISGYFIIAGAWNESDLGTSSGSAYIYENVAGTWTQTAKLNASDATAYDYFGKSVAITNGFAIVGAYEKDNVVANDGAAYIFKNNAGTWQQDAKLLASDGEVADYFGIGVSVDGNYAVVGAYYESDGGVRCGSSYVFYNNGSSWQEQKKITPSVGGNNFYFGFSVGISTDKVICGAYGDSQYGASAGSAGFYSQNDGGANNWGENSRVLPSPGAANDNFGNSVAISSTDVIVGSYADDGAVANCGSVWFYSDNGTEWEWKGRFYASDAAADDNFGQSVAIDADYAVVGSPNDDPMGVNSGSVYIFKKTAGVWAQYAKIVPADGTAGDLFGYSVAISGNYIVIGAKGDKINAFTNGSAYIYFNNSGTWQFDTKLIASDLTGNDYFGASVSISGEDIIIGAYGDSDVGTSSGSAYIFHNNAGIWSEETILTASDMASTDYFGFSVSISGSYAAIGAYANDDNGSSSGSAYIFHDNGTSWSQTTKLLASDAAAGDYFGYSVSISGNYVLVGSHLSDNPVSNGGAVYLFENNAGTWSQKSRFVSSLSLNSAFFGKSVSLNGNIAAIGAEGYSANGSSSGAAYVFGQILPSVSTQPIDVLDACLIGSTQFSISGVGISSYQWQKSSDGGTLWSNLSEVAPFSGTQTAVLTISDASGLNNNLFRCVVSNMIGNDTSDAAEIQIETENPVITSTHADQVISAGAACSASLPDYTGTVTATDNCDISLTISQSPLAGTSVSGATNTVVLTATDDAGNFSQVSFNVAVADNSNPVISSVHSNQTVSGNASCQATLADYASTVVATDNCDATLSIVQSPVAGTTISGATNLVTLSVSDDDGNMAQVSFNVEVADLTAPSITSTHPDATINANASCSALLPDYTNSVVATDYCDVSVSISQLPVPGTSVSGSTNTVTLRATDDAGNYSEVSFNVAVADNSNPSITSSHPDQIISAGSLCNATLPDYTASVVASDNCDASLAVTQNPAAGTTLAGAVNTVTLRATDDAGNYSEVSFNVEVEDVSNPVITSTHPNQTVNADVNCSAIVPDYTGTIVATDNCDANLTFSQSPVAGATISSHTNTIHLLATDDAGNYSEVTFLLTIVDNTSPVITSVHSDVILSSTSNCEAVLPDYTSTVAATDNCDPFLTVSQSPLAGSTISGSSNTVTLTVTDDGGNFSQVSFNALIADNDNPVITSSHTDQFINANSSCEASLPDYTTSVVATDNCDASLSIVQNPMPGTAISGSTNNIIITVSDDAGNYSETNFNVSVVDVSNPELVCVGNQQIDIPQGQTSYTVVGTEFDPISATDNCNLQSVINDFNATSSLAGVSLPLGTTTIVWTATDADGNYTECIFDIEVQQTVGLETDLVEEIGLWPNPTTGPLFLISSGDMVGKLIVRDVTGRIVMQYEGIFQHQLLDLTSQTTGVYFIQLQTGEATLTFKVIKE